MRSSLIIFQKLDEDDVAWIHRACRLKHFDAGAVLIDSGAINGDVSLLLRGRCTVTAPDGRVLDMLNPGDLLGEVSFVDKRRTVARVTAATSVDIAALDEDVLSAKLSQDVAFANRFYLAVACALAFRLRRNLQIAITGREDIMDSAQEFVGEIDPVDLEATAKAGARLSHLLNRLMT